MTRVKLIMSKQEFENELMAHLDEMTASELINEIPSIKDEVSSHYSQKIHQLWSRREKQELQYAWKRFKKYSGFRKDIAFKLSSFERIDKFFKEDLDA